MLTDGVRAVRIMHHPYHTKILKFITSYIVDSIKAFHLFSILYTSTCMHTTENNKILQVLAIEFVLLAIEFVPLANEFVPLVNEFILLSN